VLHGETGFLVPGGDRDALVGRLRGLAADRELALRMGDAGRARLAREFTVARLVRSLERVYLEALS
jgi:glycosyltransferase involved in cell wall biosynthesis